jgi:hypothetical protein
MREEREKGKLKLAEGSQSGGSEMCDYSRHNVKSRPAKVGDKLSTRDFGTGTRGFAASEDVTWRSAFYREPSCPLPVRLRAYQPVCWLGAGQ